ncbi:hypothetical protein [Burkholderia cepacia]|uniref:hypothetical protein n=1 Tax=Burkholderia cepacia TaxID=292 RepID=UPI0012D926B5|nr:hypothetical protein [Burkholderia cepacia]
MALYDNFSEWRHAAPSQRERASYELAQVLPTGFAFDAVRSFELAGRQCEIAQFTLGTARFSLIPGNTVQLGFDVANWTPTPDMIESWRDTAQEYGIEESLHDYVDARTSEIRTATVAPLLVENQYAEVGWRQIDSSDAEVQALLQQHPRGVTSFGDVTTRVTVTDSGHIIAERADENDLSHAAIATNFIEAGFRLPTPDEWEYFCGTGATTLFRWGDHVPCDRYPTDISPEEATWRRQWALSSGQLERPEAGFRRDWEFHRVANAFGLHIASDPYKMELTTQAGLTFGGDGGGAICGGAGFLSGWLPLASAWNDPDVCQHAPDVEISLGYTVARRVLPLT